MHTSPLKIKKRIRHSCDAGPLEQCALVPCVRSTVTTSQIHQTMQHNNKTPHTTTTNTQPTPAPPLSQQDCAHAWRRMVLTLGRAQRAYHIHAWTNHLPTGTHSSWHEQVCLVIMAGTSAAPPSVDCCTSAAPPSFTNSFVE